VACTTELIDCSTTTRTWVIARPTIALTPRESSVLPVGLSTGPNSEVIRPPIVLIACVPTYMIAPMRNTIPKANQKRPRVRRQERMIAARTPAPSSTRSDGTSMSLVPIQTASTTTPAIPASTARTAKTMPGPLKPVGTAIEKKGTPMMSTAATTPATP
jgi:hypothetical protein